MSAVRRVGLPALLAAVLVAAAVWAYVQHGAKTDQQDVRRASADAVATTLDVVPDLLSYDPATLRADIASSQQKLTPRFRPEFAQLQKELIEPAVGKEKVLTTATVDKVGVTSASATRVTLLVFLEQQTAKAGEKASPISTRATVRLVLVHGRWLVDDLTPV